MHFHENIIIEVKGITEKKCIVYVMICSSLCKSINTGSKYFVVDGK